MSLNLLHKNRLSLLKNPSFTFFAFSSLLATLGNGLNYILLATLAYNLTSSLKGIAIMMFFSWVPGFILSPLLGIIVDRFNRKTLIILSNIGRGSVLIFYMALILWAIHISELWLFILWGILGSLYSPSAMAYLGTLIEKEKLVLANTTLDMIYEIGFIVGLGLSGWILVLFSFSQALFIGGVLLILAGLLNIPMASSRASSQSLSEEPISCYKSFIEGWQYFITHPSLRSIGYTQILLFVLLMSIPLLLLPYTQEVLKLDKRFFSYYEIVFSLGAFLGGIINPFICRYLTLEKTLSFLLILTSVTLVLIGFNKDPYKGLVIYAFIGFSLSSWALSVTLTQTHCESSYQGRIFSLLNGLGGLGIFLMYTLIALTSQKLSLSFFYYFQSSLALIGFFLMRAKTTKSKDLSFLE